MSGVDCDTPAVGVAVCSLAVEVLARSFTAQRSQGGEAEQPRSATAELLQVSKCQLFKGVPVSLS